MNVVSTWLALIGTPERARKLRARVDGLIPPSPIDPLFGPEPNQCPTTVLFGAEVARLLYGDPAYRPALDAWDTGAISKGDIRRFCLAIEKGEAVIDPFYPDVSWREYRRRETILNGQKAASLRQIPVRRTEKVRAYGSSRGRRLALGDTGDH